MAPALKRQVAPRSGRHVFVSDVHLNPERPEVTRRFLDFLAREAGRADAIYLLGDIFDFWIGPKHLDHAARTDPHASRALFRPVQEAFKACNEAGTKLVMLLGNREHLFGPRCADLLGLEWHSNRVLLELDDNTVLGVHGDLFASRDIWYRFSRWLLRWKPIHDLRDILPESFVHFLAVTYIKLTAWSTDSKPRRILEIVPEELARAFAKANVVVTGHFHQHAVRRYRGAKKEYTLYQLGSWERGGSALVYDGGKFEMEVW